MARWPPARMIPPALLASGLLQLGEGWLLHSEPRLASVLIYLHMAGLGAVLLSGFWSMLNEEFDPREAKRSFGRIAAGGTLGAISGGVLGERVIAWFSAESLMILLAATHISCALIIWLLGVGRRAPGKPADEPRETVSLKDALEKTPYLKNLAGLVLLAAAGATLMNFVFVSQATVSVGKGPGLLRFFLLFNTGTSLLSFVVQSLGSRWSLEKLGLGRTVAALPTTLLGGSLANLMLPGLVMVTAGRAAEAVIRGSLFRSAYEVCFTPIPAAEKRSAKSVIDVGADRAGDAVGSGLVQLCLWLAAAEAPRWILICCMGVSAAAFWMSKILDDAYVKSLARNLVSRGKELEIDSSLQLDMRSMLGHTTALTDHSIVSAPESMAGAAAAGERAGGLRPLPDDSVLRELVELRSGDVVRIRAALHGTDTSNPVIAAQVIQLLRRPEMGKEIRAALRFAGKKIVGTLCDQLLDPGQDLGIRRQIPRLLATYAGRRALHGLVLGLEDERFEVRMECARALVHMKSTRPDLDVPSRLIYTAVDRELSAGKVIWEGHRLQTQDTNAFGQEWLDEFLKERAHGSLEYVFLLLALIYPREPLTVAFRALHTEDRHLHGTALEYLESILPDKTRQMLWDIIQERPKPAEPREAQQVMDDLLKASPTVVIRLKNIQKPDRP
jgi:ATP:ADP antiporter, AAA family